MCIPFIKYAGHLVTIVVNRTTFRQSGVLQEVRHSSGRDLININDTNLMKLC